MALGFVLGRAVDSRPVGRDLLDLLPALERAAPPELHAEAAPLKLSGGAEAMVGSTFNRTRVLRRQTAALTVTPAELTFLDGLAPLMGDTPRSHRRPADPLRRAEPQTTRPR